MTEENNVPEDENTTSAAPAIEVPADTNTDTAAEGEEGAESPEGEATPEA